MEHVPEDMNQVPTLKLLKALPNYFESTGNIEQSAFLNWRFDAHRQVENQFYEMANAYFDTALLLLNKCLTDNWNKKADVWIFPIMFEVVHGIELYLKGFNSQYPIFHKMQNAEYQESKIEGKHDIQQLCSVALQLVRKAGDKDLHLELLFIKKFIDILYQNTKDMTFARYPIDADKKPQFYVLDKDNVTIDLTLFRIWILRVHNILHRITDYIDNRIDEMKEYLYELQQYYE